MRGATHVSLQFPPASPLTRPLLSLAKPTQDSSDGDRRDDDDDDLSDEEEAEEEEVEKPTTAAKPGFLGSLGAAALRDGFGDDRPVCCSPHTHPTSEDETSGDWLAEPASPVAARARMRVCCRRDETPAHHAPVPLSRCRHLTPPTGQVFEGMVVLLGNSGVGKTLQLRALQSNGRLAGVPEPSGGVPSSSTLGLMGAMAGGEAGMPEATRGGGSGSGSGGGGGGEQLRDMKYERTLLPTPGRMTIATEKEICQLTYWDMCAAHRCATAVAPLATTRWLSRQQRRTRGHHEPRQPRRERAQQPRP